MRALARRITQLDDEIADHDRGDNHVLDADSGIRVRPERARSVITPVVLSPVAGSPCRADGM
jgi:hypothetical protein